MKSPLFKPAFYLAALGIAASSAALRADSLTVEGDLNVDGKLGVGTPTPSEKLEVNGNVKVSGTLTTTGAVTATSVTLPDGSSLTSAKATTLYNAAGQPVATVDASGKVVFANGIAVGSDPAATITPSSTAYLNQTLANLGFRENPVVATPVSSVSISGNVDIRTSQVAGGNLYLIGRSYGTAQVGGLAIAKPSTPPPAGYNSDVSGHNFVVKLNAAGIAQWSFSLEGIYDARMAIDGSGNVIIAGATLESGTLIKIGPNGVQQWRGTLYDFKDVAAIAVDSTGTIFLGGSYAGTLVGGIPSLGGSRDAIVVKVGSTGGLQWYRTIAGQGTDQITAMAVDNQGGVYAGGNFNAPLANLGGVNNITPVGGTDGMVVKLNSSNVLQWARQVGGAGGDQITSLVVGASENIAIGGSFYGNFSSGSSNVVSAGGQDGFVAVLTSAGTTSWVKSIGGSGYDGVATVAMDAAGNVVVGGGSMGVLTGLGGVTVIGNDPRSFVLKFNSSGVAGYPFSFGASYSYVAGLGSANTDIWVTGYNDVRWAVGDKYLAAGGFAIRVGTLDITTPVAGGAASLAWGAGGAINNGVSLGAGYASGVGSVALGQSTAIAENSFATGTSTASGAGGVALGVGAQAGGVDSVALGSYTYAWGANSFSAGSGGTAIADNSIVMGSGAISFGWGSVALGIATRAQAFGVTVVGYSNVAQGNTTDWVPTDDLFVVGNGPEGGYDSNEEQRNNAFVVHKNGNTRVGGNLDVKGTVRVKPSGDLLMGEYTAGRNPAAALDSPTPGLNGGLRYPGE
jgi:hypothetical protein